MSKIRVLLVDDHAILRQGLRAILDAAFDIQVVGEAGEGQEALCLIRELHPDVVLMDISMPGMNGLTATRYIRENFPDVKVIVLTQHKSLDYVKPLMAVGASGYVLKQNADVDLINVVRAVYRGQTFITPELADALAQARVEGDEYDDSLEKLTPREREVLVLIALGHTTKEIAEILMISPKTVDVHRTQLMKKLDLHNVADLTRYAIRKGLVEPV